MKLSIIVPVYNVSEYLEKCVESLLKQPASVCEILLIDDGSTDGKSGALCDRYAAAYPERIRTFHKPNGGLGDARNFGLREARGEYVFFVDSDDYITENAVEQLLPHMDAGRDVIIFGFFVDTEGTIGEPRLDNLPARTVMTLEQNPELLLAAPNAWNKLWRRSLYTENGIQFPPRAWYEDLSTSGKLLALAREIVFVPEACYYYVVREGSITRSTDTTRNAEIMDAVRSITEWFHTQNRYDRFCTELEAMAVFHVYLTASVRVLRIDAASPVLEQLQRFMMTEFPEWVKNPYLSAYPAKHRLILFLLRHRLYRVIQLLFKLKGG